MMKRFALALCVTTICGGTHSVYARKHGDLEDHHRRIPRVFSGSAKRHEAEPKKEGYPFVSLFQTEPRKKLTRSQKNKLRAIRRMMKREQKMERKMSRLTRKIGRLKNLQNAERKKIIFKVLKRSRLFKSSEDPFLQIARILKRISKENKQKVEEPKALNSPPESQFRGNMFPLNVQKLQEKLVEVSQNEVEASSTPISGAAVTGNSGATEPAVESTEFVRKQELARQEEEARIKREAEAKQRQEEETRQQELARQEEENQRMRLEEEKLQQEARQKQIEEEAREQELVRQKQIEEEAQRMRLEEEKLQEEAHQRLVEEEAQKKRVEEERVQQEARQKQIEEEAREQELVRQKQIEEEAQRKRLEEEKLQEEARQKQIEEEAREQEFVRQRLLEEEARQQKLDLGDEASVVSDDDISQIASPAGSDEEDESEASESSWGVSEGSDFSSDDESEPSTDDEVDALKKLTALDDDDDLKKPSVLNDNDDLKKGIKKREMEGYEEVYFDPSSLFPRTDATPSQDFFLHLPEENEDLNIESSELLAARFISLEVALETAQSNMDNVDKVLKDLRAYFSPIHDLGRLVQVNESVAQILKELGEITQSLLGFEGEIKSDDLDNLTFHQLVSFSLQNLRSKVEIAQSQINSYESNIREFFDNLKIKINRTLNGHICSYNSDYSGLAFEQRKKKLEEQSQDLTDKLEEFRTLQTTFEKIERSEGSVWEMLLVEINSFNEWANQQAETAFARLKTISEKYPESYVEPEEARVETPRRGASPVASPRRSTGGLHDSEREVKQLPSSPLTPRQEMSLEDLKGELTDLHKTFGSLLRQFVVDPRFENDSSFVRKVDSIYFWANRLHSNLKSYIINNITLLSSFSERLLGFNFTDENKMNFSFEKLENLISLGIEMGEVQGLFNPHHTTLQTTLLLLKSNLQGLEFFSKKGEQTPEVLHVAVAEEPREESPFLAVAEEQKGDDSPDSVDPLLDAFEFLEDHSHGGQTGIAAAQTVEAVPEIRREWVIVSNETTTHAPDVLSGERRDSRKSSNNPFRVYEDSSEGMEGPSDQQPPSSINPRALRSLDNRLDQGQQGVVKRSAPTGTRFSLNWLRTDTNH